MKFRVTSVTSEETAEPLRSATCQVEDWLNAALGDGDFGDGLDQLTVVVVSIDDDPGENQRWAEPHNKLGRFKHPITSNQVHHLSVSVQVPPALIASLSSSTLLSTLRVLISEKLAMRPARVPSGFSFERLSAAVSATLAVYGDAA